MVGIWNHVCFFLIIMDFFLYDRLFNVPLKNTPLIWRNHHFRGSQGWHNLDLCLAPLQYWVGRVVYGTKLTVTRDLGFWGLIRGTLSPYIVAFYDMQGVLMTDSNSGLYGIFMIHQNNVIESFRRIWNVFFWDFFCRISNKSWIFGRW